ncbi:MAG: hypothetical protein IPL28_02420 [Chloroflexi bacterium]|nr:hypothetical protein [Chloroflexota bacterium]
MNLSKGRRGEDSDWTIRMKQAGFELHFGPMAVVRHAPLRANWSSLIRHWVHSGYNNIRVRLRYEQEYQTPFWAKRVWGLRLLSPVIALYTTLAIFKNRLSWPYWRSIPIVYATKVIYC